jgi:L-cysteine S-thiosulfotransferase
MLAGCATSLAPTPAPPAGNAATGRALVANRQQSLCLLCHQAPIPEERFQGDIGPPLAGVGARFTAAQLRARIQDSRALQADSIMPAYARTTGLNNVGASHVGKTIFTEQQLGDVVAYLQTLR